MRTALLVSLAVVVGCKARDPYYCMEHPDRCNDAGLPYDMPPDNNIDARLDFGGGDFAIHVTAPPAMASISFNPGATLNTDADDLCQGPSWVNAAQPSACFLYANTISIQDGLEVTGARPLVVLAASTIMVGGLVDVASHVTTGKVAPGSVGTQPPCKPFVSTPTPNLAQGGGGAGGSFITLAGNGGAGNGNAGGTAAGADTLSPTVLRGGCDGQAGATSSVSGAAGGAAGRGGGAIYFVAGGSITLGATAIINASGSGAGAASKSSGGGGGGSGGMIVLYAPSIVASGARLLANGGSGSTGSNNGGGTIGNDPPATTPLVQASGPTGTGGAGGAGYAGGNDATGGGTSSNGGGGGGGASGSIQSHLPLTGATSSPEALTL